MKLFIVSVLVLILALQVGDHLQKKFGGRKGKIVSCCIAVIGGLVINLLFDDLWSFRNFLFLILSIPVSIGFAVLWKVIWRE